MVKKLSFFCAAWAEALDDVFGLFGDKTVGEGDGRYGYVGKTESVVADAAGEVDVTAALARVVVLAYAVFLRTTTVVDIVQEMGVAEEGESAEECGFIDCG